MIERPNAARAFGGKHLAIIGGAVPGLLVPKSPSDIPPHVGTADLDLHLSPHLLDEAAVVLGGVLASRGHLSLALLIVVVVVTAAAGPPT